MKKNLKYFVIIVIFLFSFIYTHQITTLIKHNSKLYKEIIDYKDKNDIMAENAVIQDDYIIPGLNGRIVDINKSYNNMKKTNEFNENLIVFNIIKPEISTENSNLIIKKANPNKNAISFISKNSSIINYAKNNNLIIDDLNNHKEKNIDSTYSLDNYSFLKKKILPGDIINVDSLTIENFKFIYESVLFNGINILKLEDLISENR